MTIGQKGEEASHFFHGVEHYNCAQAVLKAYQVEAGVSDCAINAASRAGGGMAQGGTCGALHAAKVILDDPASAQQVQEAFMNIAGSTQCREIRSTKKVSCRDCVSLAASLVEMYTGRLHPDDPAFAAELQEREWALLPMQSACERVARQEALEADHSLATR